MTNESGAMLLKGYTIFSLLVAAGFVMAGLNGWRVFAPVAPGVYYGGGHGSGGYHSTWHGGK